MLVNLLIETRDLSTSKRTLTTTEVTRERKGLRMEEHLKSDSLKGKNSKIHL